MECIRRRAHTRALGFVLSFIALVGLVGLVSLGLTGCGKEELGGSLEESNGYARKELPPADQIGDSNDQLNIAIHYVSYLSTAGTAVASEASVRSMISRINTVWSQCGIGVVLEKYETLNPATIGASYNPGTYSAIDQVREKLTSAASLLMVATGTWGRSADLGSANCYSSFPGDSADGIICEGAAATNGYLQSHEVGHWFNLRHTNDPTSDLVDDTDWSNNTFNLMQSVVGPDQSEITEGQCHRARTSVGESRRSAVVI